MHACGRVPIKLYLQEQVVGRTASPPRTLASRFPSIFRTHLASAEGVSGDSVLPEMPQGWGDRAGLCLGRDLRLRLAGALTRRPAESCGLRHCGASVRCAARPLLRCLSSVETRSLPRASWFVPGTRGFGGSVISLGFGRCLPEHPLGVHACSAGSVSWPRAADDTVTKGGPRTAPSRIGDTWPPGP